MTSPFINIVGARSQMYKGTFLVKLAYGPIDTNTEIYRKSSQDAWSGFLNFQSQTNESC